jgi:hypothetical protein
VAIHKGSKADLVGNSEARQSLDDDADHDAEHGSAAIEEFNALELIVSSSKTVALRANTLVVVSGQKGLRSMVGCRIPPCW